MDMNSALEELGVSDDTLSGKEKFFLDRNGYLYFTDILSSDAVNGFNESLANLPYREEDSGRKTDDFQSGTVILRDLINKDSIFDICFTHPRILAAVSHVLPQGYKLSTVASRSALPGGGHQPLHPDWHPEWWRDRKKPSHHFSCNTIWMLDDFTPENGATRVVPGSHLGLGFPEDEMEDVTKAHPSEIQLEGKAGTVVVFTGHTWHGGVLNRNQSPRRSMTAYFCQRDQPQQTAQRQAMLAATRRRLNQAVLFLLDTL